MERAIFKYNGGLGALLCSSCRVIMKIGSSFTDEEIMAIKGKLDMPPQYCKQCKPNIMTTQEKAAWLVLKFMSKVVSKNVAKECALVAIDEMIKVTPWNGENDTQVEDFSKEFYINVKAEIEKL
jgi:hypothetical protein